jgi:hypothetical protein
LPSRHFNNSTAAQTKYGFSWVAQYSDDGYKYKELLFEMS